MTASCSQCAGREMANFKKGEEGLPETTSSSPHSTPHYAGEAATPSPRQRGRYSRVRTSGRSPAQVRTPPERRSPSHRHYSSPAASPQPRDRPAEHPSTRAACGSPCSTGAVCSALEALDCARPRVLDDRAARSRRRGLCRMRLWRRRERCWSEPRRQICWTWRS